MTTKPQRQVTWWHVGMMAGMIITLTLTLVAGFANQVRSNATFAANIANMTKDIERLVDIVVPRTEYDIQRADFFRELGRIDTKIEMNWERAQDDIRQLREDK